MPWLAMYEDGRNGRIEFFYTNDSPPQVTRLRAQNPTDQDYRIRIWDTDANGSRVEPPKIDITYPPGTTPAQSDQSLPAGTFTTQDADGGGFTWFQYVEAGPVFPHLAADVRGGGRR